ncbi:MAG TPA: glycosyltransferase [Nitrosomonas sp.]|nr:glycosyltransferase [Nitrosomonas sp.]HQX12939.1 glycosyltransferase [Nitrosomonas sp.]HRB32590.1 glycosyltransferase [Nitrosomonas sp.]HRB45859.1 glycosyltransferase [Nitrosomonas sp.]HRB77793.1 glycosyltransferase [Nitrosomonas sp.]
MKIVHVIAGLTDGGAEGVLYRLCLQDQLNTHTVLSLTDGGKYGPLLQTDGIALHCLNMPRGRLTWAGVVRLYRLIRDLRPDVVQTWMYHADFIGGLIAKIAGVRRVYWGVRNSLMTVKESGWVIFFLARINAFLSRWIPVGVICCADRAKDMHQNIGYAANKLITIPNGYNLDSFKPDSKIGSQLRVALAIDESIPLLGCVSRYSPQKNHEGLLKALSLVKKNGIAFRCLLVGRGLDTDNTQLVSWLIQYGLQDEILLLGQRKDVPAIMNALDLHVLPSTAEGFPNVIAEAMACETPCVSTDVGDAAYIIGQTGWLVPPADAQLLAEAIQSALVCWNDKTAWSLRRTAARTRIMEHFSLEKMVATYRATWENGLQDVSSV